MSYIELSGPLIAPAHLIRVVGTVMPTANPSLDVVNLINEYRVGGGVPPVEVVLPLTLAAIDHAWDMSVHRFQDHKGSDGSSPWDRMRRRGYNYRWAGEIIGSGYPDYVAMAEGWWNSPPHHHIMMDPNYTQVGPCAGMGADGMIYWVCDFGSPLAG
jgi:uncharacterized protein YkwD